MAGTRYYGPRTPRYPNSAFKLNCIWEGSAGAADLLGDVLTYGKDVAVGIFEPGYLAAVGGGPDAEVLVLGEGILFRGDAAVPEPGGDGLDVFDLPAEDGALQRSEILNLNDANHVAADAHD